MEIFAGLEANGLAGRDADFGTCAGVATDTGLSWFNGEDAEASQLDSVALGKSALHGLKDGIDGRLGFDAREPGAFDDTLNEILLDQ
jgi:hypothetical protein